MKLAGIEVAGISVGGLETCIDLPAHKLAFDIGRAPDAAVARKTILFTHAHMDHMGGVAWHCATRALRGMPPPTYVVPRENVDAFRDLFEVWRKLDRSLLKHELVPLAPGEELALDRTRVVRPFRSVHRVPCQGYSIWSRRAKLKPHYQGLAQAEIQRLRVECREEVTHMVETAEVAFTGDTRIEVVEQEAVVRTARLLIIEVTFLDERVCVESARDKGHIHLDEVVERADLFENEALLFTHFSDRYGDREIVALLDAKLPDRLRQRVTPLLSGRHP